MANPEHLAKLRESADAWNKWRKAHPDIVPDLSYAVLQGYDLRVRNFWDSNLRGARLNLSNLRGALFCAANLSGADLRSAQLDGANLERANLREANLILASLNEAELGGVNFYGATIGWTTFGNNDLRGAKHLDTVLHEGPSTIGLDTIYRSRGNIPGPFLRQAGVPESFIEYMPSLTTSESIQFYSCFISYSNKDSSFATELHTQLQAQGVRRWKDSEDLKIGDKFQEEIERAIRLHDKLLVVLSENSVTSTWVEREVQAAFEKEQRQGLIVLFPVRLDDAVMDSPRAWAADIRRTRHIGDFRNWKNQASFRSSLNHLIRDLKSQKFPPTKQVAEQGQSLPNIEEQILEALANGQWGPGPFTGGGDRLVRVAEIAEALSLEKDVVADSLEQLETRGRVTNHGGTLDNPAPYWSIRRRW